ncbi:hypothetical protein CRUP_005567 [Coryphaenoides rupestris]|nr:hypothetical protein CRUP_005567 [Coryphaenoides rupestris]
MDAASRAAASWSTGLAVTVFHCDRREEGHTHHCGPTCTEPGLKKADFDLTGCSHTRMTFSYLLPPPLLLLLFLPLLAESTESSNNTTTAASSPPTSTAPSSNSTSSPLDGLVKNSSVQEEEGVWGCGAGLDLQAYRYLCDRRAVWGPVLEALASLGFLLSAGLLLGLLLWVCCRPARCKCSSGLCGTLASVSLFLLATAGLFALTFAFIAGLTPRTCPVRIFLFGVLFSMALSCLLARAAALLGFAAARGWGEPALALGLFSVQVVIATQWLLVVLVRDQLPCQYTQDEFVMLQIYVLCLLAAGLLLSLHCLCRSCRSYGYSGAGGRWQSGRTRATALFLTLLLSTAIWVVWIVMLTWGNDRVGRRPRWDDPVLAVVLVTNGWVFLLGHGLAQVVLLCQEEARAKEGPLSFAGWTSPNAEIPGLGSQKEGRENGSFENDGSVRKGRCSRRRRPGNCGRLGVAVRGGCCSCSRIASLKTHPHVMVGGDGRLGHGGPHSAIDGAGAAPEGPTEGGGGGGGGGGRCG